VFHVEIRQFPHATRAFNLTREQLDARFARPWVAGTEIEYEDRRWNPAKARLVVFEGPELGLEELGLGRGWQAVGKQGREVTETILAEVGPAGEGRGALELVKAEVRGAARAPLRLPEVIALVRAEYPASRPSEQLGLAEQAVWELLHQERIELRGASGALGAEDWPAVLLSWETWTGASAQDLVLALPDTAG
jgi:hypothetical protein